MTQGFCPKLKRSWDRITTKPNTVPERGEGDIWEIDGDRGTEPAPPAPLDLDLTVASSGSNIPPLSVSVFMLFAVAAC